MRYVAAALRLGLATSAALISAAVVLAPGVKAAERALVAEAPNIQVFSAFGGSQAPRTTAAKIPPYRVALTLADTFVASQPPQATIAVGYPGTDPLIREARGTDCLEFSTEPGGGGGGTCLTRRGQRGFTDAMRARVKRLMRTSWRRAFRGTPLRTSIAVGVYVPKVFAPEPPTSLAGEVYMETIGDREFSDADFKAVAVRTVALSPGQTETVQVPLPAMSCRTWEELSWVNWTSKQGRDVINSLGRIPRALSDAERVGFTRKDLPPGPWSTYPCLPAMIRVWVGSEAQNRVPDPVIRRETRCGPSFTKVCLERLYLRKTARADVAIGELQPLPG